MGLLNLIFPDGVITSNFSLVDKSVYRTVRVTNNGDTPVKFCFQESTGISSSAIGGEVELASEGGPIFSVKPKVGMLHPTESRLIVLRFSPSEQRIYNDTITCYFNDTASSRYDLQVQGYGYYPQLSFDNELHFKPTCIGAVAERKFTIRNNSKINVIYEWTIPKQYASVVSITPASGLLTPNGSSSLQCTFAPFAVSQYKLEIPCYFNHEGSEKELKKRATLSVIGTAIRGIIQSKPDIVDFETILVNTISERDITLFNPSECDIFYTLEVYKYENGGVYLLSNKLKESEIEVYQHSKVLPARSNTTVKVKACPKTEKSYEFRIFYKADTQEIALSEGLSVPIYMKQENTVKIILTLEKPIVYCSRCRCASNSQCY